MSFIGSSDDAATDAVPIRELGDAKIPFDVLKLIPEESAQHYQLIPLEIADEVLHIGMVDPSDIKAVDALNFIARVSGMPYKIFRISSGDFERVISMYRGLRGEVGKAVSDLETEQKSAAPIKTAPGSEAEAPLDLGGISAREIDDHGHVMVQEDAPTIKIVSTILRYAIDGKASDIHIEPQTKGVRVRYRVDGVLHTSVLLPPSAHRALVARIKVLSSLRLDEQRKPQDGRFSAMFDNRVVDFRVSTFPSYDGEKVVIRILDRDTGFRPLSEIGLTPRNLDVLRRAIERPHGIILVSGPTGSGKSTTLYSLLNEIDRETKNILSLEDPVEYHIDGINQSQVRPEIGYTFANGLRTTLRQDPDVIMVGEIRDSETAKLAFQAALTGHLVLSTVHTNDAIGTIPRLIDMGVEPYLIPPILIASVAQRLTRTLCDSTGEPFDLSASDRALIEAQQQTLPEKFRFDVSNTVYRPKSTSTCPTGLRGRMAVFEILEMSREIESIILKNPVDSELWGAARRTQGMLTMQEDALIKAFAQQIPYSEVGGLSSLMLSVDEEGEAAAEAAQQQREGLTVPASAVL